MLHWSYSKLYWLRTELNTPCIFIMMHVFVIMTCICHILIKFPEQPEIEISQHTYSWVIDVFKNCFDAHPKKKKKKKTIRHKGVDVTIWNICPQFSLSSTLDHSNELNKILKFRLLGTQKCVSTRTFLSMNTTHVHQQ